MCLCDSKRSSVGRHRADAKIGMRPQHGVAHRRIDLIDDTDESFGRHHWTQSAHARSRAGTEYNCGLISHSAAVQGLGRYETPAEAGAKPDDLSQAVILALERAGLHRVE